MVLLEIGQVKAFMAGFLGGGLFDDFLMNEGKLCMDITYEFDGKLQKDFYDSEEWETVSKYPYIAWQQQKERVFSLIKGKKTPLLFQFTMMLKPEYTEDFLGKYNIGLHPEEVNGLFINVKYSKNQLQCTTGVSRKTFSMDKVLEEAWDMEAKERLREFL